MLRDVLTQKGLSNREAEVAELVTKGLSNKEVANQLFVTEKTVKFHLTNIYKKMNVKSRSQLIVWCMPHMSFQENEVEAASQTRTIPAGNSIVGNQPAQTIPAPQNNVRLVGQPSFSTGIPAANSNAFGNKIGGNDGNSGNNNSGF